MKSKESALSEELFPMAFHFDAFHCADDALFVLAIALKHFLLPKNIP